MCRGRSIAWKCLFLRCWKTCEMLHKIFCYFSVGYSTFKGWNSFSTLLGCVFAKRPPRLRCLYYLAVLHWYYFLLYSTHSLDYLFIVNETSRIKRKSQMKMAHVFLSSLLFYFCLWVFFAIRRAIFITFCTSQWDVAPFELFHSKMFLPTKMKRDRWIFFRRMLRTRLIFLIVRYTSASNLIKSVQRFIITDI